MSKQRSNYPGSRWDRFSRWMHGEYDPFAGKLEMKRPEEQKTPPPLDFTKFDLARAERAADDLRSWEMRAFRKLYKLASVVLCVSIIVILLMTVANLPHFGDPDAPANNEVSARYIASGLQETGAVNIVTGMILNYRGFDTLGETTVLFVATCCVMILLITSEKESEDMDRIDESVEPNEDRILKRTVECLFPMIFLFGVYILMNGHLSPGGGFSGGAIIGAGLILYLNAFHIGNTRRFFNEHIYEIVKITALIIYAVTIAYHVFTGANGLPNLIPLGTPGAILSSGMIFWINLCVGFEVACTMYAFFALFCRGNM